MELPWPFPPALVVGAGAPTGPRWFLGATLESKRAQRYRTIANLSGKRVLLHLWTPPSPKAIPEPVPGVRPMFPVACPQVLVLVRPAGGAPTPLAKLVLFPKGSWRP